MAADVTVRTSLLEHRLLAGSRAAVSRSSAGAFAATLDVRAFYEAKVLEQQQRHLKYHDAAYNLEPNVKESPGGLRDLQTVLWIARAAGLGRTWRELARHGLMTPREARAVVAAGALHRRRCACGCTTSPDRREDRLVFDLQSALARAARARRHAGAARERAADAALLPRREARAPGQHDPAAEPARAPLSRRRPSRCRSTPISSAVDELLDMRDDDAVRARPGGDARRVPRRCSGIPS